MKQAVLAVVEGAESNRPVTAKSETALVVLDNGEANRRILAKKEHRADFRRVEAASLKHKTRLESPEGKRLFARCFYSFQASMYIVSTLGRTKLPLPDVEHIEQAVRAKLEEATTELNRAIDGADLLLKNHNIESVATYDTVPLEEEVGITSALGRRYFELLHKLDQMMPLLQTLEIEEVISEKEAEKQRSKLKRIVLGMSSTGRNFAVGIRRRMNEADAKKAEAEHNPRNGAAKKVSQENSATLLDESPSTAVTESNGAADDAGQHE
jgi:hypothetical protein